MFAITESRQVVVHSKVARLRDFGLSVRYPVPWSMVQVIVLLF
jgi:hypothetical protein